MEPYEQSAELTIPKNQYILTHVGTRRLAFPSASVSGILLVERSHVLALPFYQKALLGIVHHQGQLVALVALQQVLEGSSGQAREVFNAVQLSENTSAPGLGLVIDRLLGTCSDDQVSSDDDIEAFQPQFLEPTLWQPKRWINLAA